MEQREFLDMVHVAGRLKDTIRHCVTPKGRPESVAEHTFRISLMAMWLGGEFPDVDIDKVIKMCLIHDLGECFTGDIPCFNKTSKDTEREDMLLAQWVDTLPDGVREEMQALYEEMNALETKEALLYKSMDKLEAVISHNESPISSWLDNEYSLQQTYGNEIVTFDEWMVKLRAEILDDTLKKIEKGE